MVVCNEPGDEIIRLLSSQLDIAPAIAEGLFSDLYRLVAGASAANAFLPFRERRRISTTETERRIFERLEAEDPSAIDDALASGALEPVDFVTTVDEPAFYRGVKVRPGHVAAGLVLARDTDTNDVVTLLKRHRHVLVTGPSGAGKSALAWLTANALAREMTWFQISVTAIATDAQAVVRFIRSRRPTEASPIGLVFDDLAAASSDLWNILVAELRGLPGVHLLGSVRQEDLSLVANRSDTQIVPVRLDEDLAMTIWEKLSAKHETTWNHWREPFERSEGLMLEYVHLLTQGDRLAAVIGEQVQQRERESRNAELAIIRSTAVLCAHYGEVEVDRLIQLLDLNPGDAQRSLKRLIDEHLILESRPGVLGGLHMLRSKALLEASHDEAVYRVSDTLWRFFTATTRDSLPRVVQSVLANADSKDETRFLSRLAEILGSSSEVDLWTAILTGLGLATLERHVFTFISILEQQGVKRAFWSLASTFVAAGTDDLPELSQFEQWPSLRDAVLAFRALPKQDLRPACLKQLPEGAEVPHCHGVRQANKMLSCLVPIREGEAVAASFEIDLAEDDDLDIGEVAMLLSTAYLIGPDRAKSIVDSLGGEQALLDRFRTQTPWATKPVIESDGPHGRTIRSNWFQVSEQYQSDPHDAVCEICETLIALVSDADAAASDAVDPLGRPVAIGDFAPASKHMPRQNLPARTRVAWNVAFRQVLLTRVGAGSLTDYAQKMGPLVGGTEKVFRTLTEKWIKGKGQNSPTPTHWLPRSIRSPMVSTPLPMPRPKISPPRWQNGLRAVAMSIPSEHC